jgi:hypothetical protein
MVCVLVDAQFPLLVTPFFQPDDLVQLRETNRRLQIDIQLLYREVDSYETGQTQPSMTENFYNNMSSTGQAGTLRPPPSGVIECKLVCMYLVFANG